MTSYHPAAIWPPIWSEIGRALSERWYVDSSVVLRIVKAGSPAARSWFEAALVAGDVFVASRLMKAEVLRVLTNNGVDLAGASDLIARFVLLSLDDNLVDEAISLGVSLGAADALHIASALRVGAAAITVVTHDAQMAAGAEALGFAVIDPVTDDPLRPPVV
ncbi:MAG: type II toxin-antitoxin system VapC family toxin [Propionibacteriaceae bacterium]|jgi:predicted nucleic acid-binding protein|nr:type II toxin-antitoxin system VapC family toxin [Propionibacteriaceae bacterium]